MDAAGRPEVVKIKCWPDPVAYEQPMRVKAGLKRKAHLKHERFRMWQRLENQYM